MRAGSALKTNIKFYYEKCVSSVTIHIEELDSHTLPTARKGNAQFGFPHLKSTTYIVFGDRPHAEAGCFFPKN